MTKLKLRSICMQLRRPSTGLGSSQGLARGSSQDHPLLKAKKSDGCQTIKKRAEGTYLAGGGADDDCESATTLDSHGRPIADNARRGGGARASATPMAAGAGLVHPQQALDPG